jgi:hypothetical protein
MMLRHAFVPPALFVAVAVAVAVVGCTQAPKPQPLTPEAFVGPRSASVSGAEGTASGSGGTVGAGESARPAVAIPANKTSADLDNALKKPAGPRPTDVPTPSPTPAPGTGNTAANPLPSSPSATGPAASLPRSAPRPGST